MKRKTFIQQLGLGCSFGWVNKNMLWEEQLFPNRPFFDDFSDLDDVRNREGHVVLRVVFKSLQNAFKSLHDRKRYAAGSIHVEGATIDNIKEYAFFEKGKDNSNPGNNYTNSSNSPGSLDILVIWLNNAEEDSTMKITVSEEVVSFSLSELIDKKQINFKKKEVNISTNFLLYQEIGEIDPRKIGISPSDDNFRFALLPDPQGGDPKDTTNDSTTRIKIHNAFTVDSIKRTNELDPVPQFSLVLGDFVDSQGQPSNYRAMMDLFGMLDTPMLVSIGNHETSYGAKFTPGYNMSAFDNFFKAQKQINGMEKILYSFNCGKWHFIVWPDPLRKNFWQTHLHYFDWLEKDLAKHKDLPTMFMQHVPSNPVGIDPLINHYVNSPTIKRMLLDILSRHGNVKYVFSGHVHIPLKASVKTAVEYKGMKMINLPAAGYRPRVFGEQDYFGGPTQGVCIVDVEGTDAKVHYKTVTRNTYNYPDDLPALDLDKYCLWIQDQWELPANDNLINGKFENGLKGWHRRYIYKEDETPSNICEVRSVSGLVGKALYIYSRKRGYDKPGEDRLPQSANHLIQAVNYTPDYAPVIQFKLKPDEQHFHPETLNGAFFWIEGFNGSVKLANIVYSVGKITNYGVLSILDNTLTRTLHLDLPVTPKKWHVGRLNILKDYNNHIQGTRFEDLGLDKLILGLGVWTVNDGYDQEIGIYFADFAFERQAKNSTIESSIDNISIKPKNTESIWEMHNEHIGGEHQFATEEELYSKLLKIRYNSIKS